MDWGYINPGCFLWFACLPDGILYVRRDLKFAEEAIEDLCDKVFAIDEELGLRPKGSRKSRVRYTVADPAVFGQYSGSTKTPSGQFKGETIDETFRRCGVPLIKADNDRTAGWLRVRQNLRLRADGRPTLLIHPECRYLIRTLASAISSKTDPEDVDTHIDDHAIDALRYGVMTRPAPTRRGGGGPSKKSFKAAQQRTADYRRSLTIR